MRMTASRSGEAFYVTASPRPLRTEHELQLILKPGDATLLRAVDLATREKACCAFFSFGIEIEAESRTLVIGSPPTQPKCSTI